MWSNFETASINEETINDVFCSNCLFKVLCEGQVEKYPKVISVLHDKKMLIAAEKTLIMLENENIAECSFLNFSSSIDSLGISKSGSIIVCCLTDGNIHGVFIKGTPVFNLCIEQDDVSTERTFADVQQMDNAFYIACTNGKVYRLFNVDEENFVKNFENRTLTENETFLFDETLMRNVVLEKIVDKPCPGRATAFAVVDTDFQVEKDARMGFSVLATEHYVNFSIGDEITKIRMPDQYGSINKIYTVEDFILGVSSSGHLFEICPLTHVLFQPYEFKDSLIEDLVVMENNENQIELLILTKPDSQNTRKMKIVSFPEMKTTYEIEMTEHTWLVKQPKTSVNIYYLVGENCTQDGLPQEIEVRIICEIEPDQRLKKLILRGHLEEAEEFGKQFELDLEPVYEAKSRKLLVDINNFCEDEKSVNDKFNQLLSTLKLIKNKSFLLTIRCCEIPSRKLMFSFLQFILDNITGENSDDIIAIKEELLRLETLRLIDPYECDMNWIKFVNHPSIIKVCVSYFKRDISLACLIWKRHIACIMPLLDIKSVGKILNALPSSTEPFSVVQWLNHFIPVVIQSIPEAMSYLVDWSIQKTRSLQYEKHWPDIGLEFASKILTIFKDVTFLYSDVRRQYDTNITKLKVIVHVLQDLSVLKKSYNLILTLDNYMKESIDDTAFHILQRVHLANLATLVNDFLYPIFLEKCKSPVDAIKKYVEFLVNSRSRISSWLERAVVCINLLYNEEEKLEAALKVLRAAPVPWPEIVMPLAKLSNSTHSLAIEIGIEYELQTIKIIKKKYGWPIDADDNNIKLINRILKLNLPDMITDIHSLIKVSPGISYKASFVVCFELSKNGEIEKALTFLELLDKNTLNAFCDKIMNIFPHILEDPRTTEEESNNMIEFMKLVAERSNILDKVLLRNIENNLLLRRLYNLKVDVGNLKDADKMLLLNQGIGSILKEFQRRKTNLINFLWRSIRTICNALDVDLLKGIKQMLKQINNVHVSCAIVYNILHSIDLDNFDAQLYIQISLLLILQQMNVDEELDDPLSYPLAYQILLKALNRKSIFKHDIIQLLVWVRVGNNLYDIKAVEEYYKNTTKAEKNILASMGSSSYMDNFNGNGEFENLESMSFFENVDQVQETVKSKKNGYPILVCLSNSLFFVFSVINEKHENNSIFKCFCKDNETERIYLKTNFFKSLDTLIKLRQYKCWLNIVQLIMKYENDYHNHVIDSNYISNNIRKIFKSYLPEEEPDFVDLFGLLLIHPDPVLCLSQLDKELKYGQAKHNFFILKKMYYHRIGDQDTLMKDKNSQMKFSYYMELCKQDPNLKGKQTIEFLSLDQLVNELRSRSLPINLLNRISYDFNLDQEHVLTSQIINILKRQKPVIEIKIDELGREKIIIKSSAEQIVEQCQPYINEITDPSYITGKLVNFMGEINFYFYELYLAVIEILVCIGELPPQMQIWKNILLFLKHKMTTKRRNKASQLETDWWLKYNVDMGVLPKIAKYRLPFRPLVEEPLKNLLDNEVCVDNCISWFPLVKLHATLQTKTSPLEVTQLQEYFCMSSVKNSILEYRHQAEDSLSDMWHLKPINNAFLQAILRLTQQMHDPAKILFILYFVTNHAPEGADQLDAAHKCYKFALRNEKLLNSPRAQETVNKIKRKYPIYRTQHLLHMFNLADDKLLQLVENPKELINALYHHELILKEEKPNINFLSMEIAQLHNLDFPAVQISLLEKWLGLIPSSDTSSPEDTFTEGLNATVTVADDISEDSISRVLYMFSCWETEIVMEYLISRIFPSEGTINTDKQMCLFECFIRILDGAHTDCSEIYSQEQYVVLKCVNNLKHLGYNFSIEKFNECDKLQILKKVWKNHANNSTALVAMTYICIGFRIEITQIWNALLKQMVKLNMLDELNAIVDLLSCKINLIHTDGLRAAWQYVLTVPFNTASRTRSNEQEELLIKNLFRIQACPLVTHLDLQEIAEICIRLERPHFAAVLMGLAGREQKVHIKSLLMNYKNEKLKDEIVELEESGILPVIVNSVLKILELS